MAAESEKQNLFEPIGNQAQGLSTGTDGAAADDDDVQPVDEIESLCMNCHENVSCPYSQRDYCCKLTLLVT